MVVSGRRQIFILILFLHALLQTHRISHLFRYYMTLYTRLYLTDIRAQQPGSVDVVTVDEKAAIGPGLTAHARTWLSSCG